MHSKKQNKNHPLPNTQPLQTVSTGKYRSRSHETMQNRTAGNTTTTLRFTIIYCCHDDHRYLQSTQC